MPIETVKIDDQGREQLIRLKRHTGVENWNVLCRWAFCASLAELTRPPLRLFRGEPAVEMAWRIFGGSHHELYLALLKQRCRNDGYALTDTVLHEQFRLHLHRGLGYLSADKTVRSIDGLVALADHEPPAAAPHP